MNRGRRGPYNKKPTKERFDKFIEMIPECGCWIWMGACDKDGYGFFHHEYIMEHAHRVSWKFRNGPIPKGMCVLHKCDVTSCVNPLHLFLGTKKDNRVDCMSKNRHACGEKQSNSKLTSSDVIAIKNSNKPDRKLAKEYGVARSLINRVKNGKSWSHIK